MEKTNTDGGTHIKLWEFYVKLSLSTRSLRFTDRIRPNSLTDRDPTDDTVPCFFTGVGYSSNF